MKELQKIQSELKAPKSQYNSFGKYKYRSAEDILESLKPHLSENSCTVVLTEEVKSVLDKVYIEATVLLANSEGETVSVKASAGVDFTSKGMSDAQRFGSSSSYARKYALGGMFLLDDTKDADATNTHGKEVKTELPPIPKTAIAEAIKAIQNGSVTIHQIQKKYTLTTEQLNTLKNA